MNGSITLAGATRAFLPASETTARAAARSEPLGLLERCWATLAATLVPVSLAWDFSWESSIGADRFWSPPHLATHIGVWLAGLLGVWLVFKFTLARHWGQPPAGINPGPFCAPAGAWVLLWSATLLQAAFLLDYWWQQTYALSAGMWPPPQILKAAGFFGILFGARLLPPQASARDLGLRHSWLGGLLVSLCALILTMTNHPNLQHTGTFYLVSCTLYPAVLLATGAGPGRWRATGVSSAYMALGCALVWVLPLFPARPLTPPIYNPLTHMMPPAFPLLLLGPALLLDLARSWLPTQRRDEPRPTNRAERLECVKLAPAIAAQLVAKSGSKLHALQRLRHPGRARAAWEPARLQLWQAGACGLGFVLTFVPIQWFFARFLLSPQSDNWVFAGGGRHWPYYLKIDQARTMFWGTKEAPFGWTTLMCCLLLAVVSAWLGLRASTALSRLRR